MLAAPGGEVDVPDGETAEACRRGRRRGRRAWGPARRARRGSPRRSSGPRAATARTRRARAPSRRARRPRRRGWAGSTPVVTGAAPRWGWRRSSAGAYGCRARARARTPLRSPTAARAPSDDRPAEPACGQRAQQVAVRDEHGERGAVEVRRGDPVQDPVAALGDLLVGLAAGARVGEHRPAGDLLTDLRRRQPLVGAVVPLHEVRVELERRQPGQLGSPDGPYQRADQHRAAAPVRSRTRPTGAASARAWRLPSESSGTSVRPVCRPARDHSVLPCRIRTTVGPLTRHRMPEERGASTRGRDSVRRRRRVLVQLGARRGRLHRAQSSGWPPPRRTCRLDRVLVFRGGSRWAGSWPERRRRSGQARQVLT